MRYIGVWDSCRTSEPPPPTDALVYTERTDEAKKTKRGGAVALETVSFFVLSRCLCFPFFPFSFSSGAALGVQSDPAIPNTRNLTFFGSVSGI